MLSATLEIQAGWGSMDMEGESGEAICFFPSFLFILDFISQNENKTELRRQNTWVVFQSLLIFTFYLG